MIQTKSPVKMTFQQSVNFMLDRAMNYLDIPKGVREEIKACNSMWCVWLDFVGQNTPRHHIFVVQFECRTEAE